MTLQVARKHFTVSEYYRMGETGIFKEDDRVELIEGEVIEMSPIGKRHLACVNRLTELFSLHSKKTFIVSVQNPLQIDDHSEPEPDISLLRRRDDFYAEKEIEPADVYLVVEIADTSIDYDRNIKIPLYARSSIPEIWLADLSNNVVEVYSQPVKGNYQTIRTFRRGESITAKKIPGLCFDVKSILG